MESSDLRQPARAASSSLDGTEADAASFERSSCEAGTFRLRPLRLPEDVDTIHAWVSQPYAHYWGLVGQSRERVLASYREIAETAHVYLGFHEDAPSFLVECYEPARHAVGRHYAVEPGDRGMHVLVAPPSTVAHGFTWSVFRVVMDFVFADPTTQRVVVEPDIRNAKIHALNRRAGFRYQKPIALPNKTAHLAFCTRQDYERALELPHSTARPSARAAGVAHLTSDSWQVANRRLLCKALSELAHERLIHPRAIETADGAWQRYALAGAADTEYHFTARVLELEHWDIEPASLRKVARGAETALDALQFFIELQPSIGLAPELAPTYLEEIASTLYAAAFKHSHQELSSAELVHAEFQEIEAAMSEGHPAFIANSGRVGFDLRDYVAHAPEAGAPVRLLWLAAQRRHAEVSLATDLSYEQLLESELGSDTLEAFRSRLAREGLDPGSYLFIPVHPWQWFNKLAFVFAADIAERDLVLLGPSADTYRAQQSIRTFFNLSHPQRRYVKTALSVLNMGFMRGLSADYMRATPAINDWLRSLLDADPFFAAHSFEILREVAGIGYRNPRFEPVLPKQSPYRKMLAALWRESPVPRLLPGQRLMTLAALLHRDREGHALLPQLIAASGVSIDAWLEQFARCYLAPLVHCLCRYDLAFMPHGENIILVLEGNVVVRVLLKDIAEEAVLMAPGRELPEPVRRIAASVPAELEPLAIFTDVFDGIFRYLSQILLEQADYPEQRFWRQIAACLHTYRRENPACAAAFERHNLFAPEFRHSCLNRLQLRDHRQMVDLSDPTAALQFAGTLRNPVAGYSSC